jgi:outer membrane biosynthesis protein TonB
VTAGFASDQGSRQERDFRRMVVFSMVAHVGALGLAIAAPVPSSLEPVGVIAVELVAPPAQSARRRAAPPAPPARPVPPKPKQVVLPKESRQPEPKPARPKPERRREVVVEQKPREEKSLEDLLSEFREESGETPPPAVETAVAPPVAPASAGAGRQVSPEVLDWVRRAKRHVRDVWVVPPGFRTQPLETHVVLRLDRSGAVMGSPRVVRRSGNPWYDENVVRGIEKASPLPAPPEAGDWTFVFRPEDSY